MKKGTIVLFVYGLFLIVSGMVATLLQDGTLGKIAVGATVAGYFFAISDE